MTLLMVTRSLTRVLIPVSCSRSSLGFKRVAIANSDNHCSTVNATISFSCFVAIGRWQEWSVYATMTKNPSTSTLLGFHCLGVSCVNSHFTKASLYLR